METKADERLVTLMLDGVAEHQGHVMARAFVEKFAQFLNTFAGFERVYLGARVRQTDFELVQLSHNSPTQMGLNPVPRVRNYMPAPAVDWIMDQWTRIVEGVRPDPRVGEDLIDSLIELARKPDELSYSGFVIRHKARAIKLDENALRLAQSVRIAITSDLPSLPWRQGTSRGHVSGELRSVLDDNGERQIVILPFIGPMRVRCTFPESLRNQVKDCLWEFVKVSGTLHYADKSPHPYLIDVETILPLVENKDGPHFTQALGMFKGDSYPSWISTDL